MTTQPYDPDTVTFLANGGEMGILMRAHDWANSPLGEPSTWPQSLRSFVGLILNSKFPMFVAWGTELAFLYNDAYAEILGDKHPLALGRRFDEIWSEIWHDIHPIVESAMAGHATYFENLPFTMNRKGYDEQTWFTFSYSPLRDENGTVAGMYCACTETTAQMNAERLRIQENESLRDLFEQAPGIMVVFREPSHVFEIANAAYRQLVGNRELIGKTVREALPEIDGQGFFEMLDRVYTTGEPVQGRAAPVQLRRASDGVWEERFCDFVYQPIKNTAGKVTGIFLEGSDVTEAVKAQSVIRENEERLRQLANTIPHLAWMADADGWIHWYNDRWYEYTGTTHAQMQGWGWQSVHDPDKLSEVMAQWTASIKLGTPFEATFPLRAANGEYRTFFTLAAPLRNADGEILQWFGTNTDVTGIEQAQEELRASNRRKDEFLAMLAHELRNPLAPISSAAELLKLNDCEGNVARQTGDIISRQVQHLTDLVDDLLDVSRVTRGLVTLQKEVVDINVVLDDSVEQVRALIDSKRQHLSVFPSRKSVLVEGDRTRLVQIFANIINNAAKYTPEQGYIVVQLTTLGHEVEVVVEDNGIGISQDLIAHIFDLFTQAERSPDRSQGGLGLGLALVKSLTELHDGSVSVTSAGPGRGSRFAVRLPLVEQVDAEPALPSQPSNVVQSSDRLRLMVVDDNVDAAEVLALLLETVGHDVVVEHSALRALARARELAPQLIFLDIGLPDVDGYELARRLRAMPETAQAVLVAVTGYGQAQDMERTKAAGIDHHLVKPVKLASILSCLPTLEHFESNDDASASST